MGYTLCTTVARPFDETLAATREALAAQGFGVLTEIDMAGTLKKKLDVDIPPQVILGACSPTNAYQAVLAEPSIGVLLPCNVVVRSASDRSTIVETIDPATMHELTSNESIKDVASTIGGMLQAVLDSLT